MLSWKTLLLFIVGVVAIGIVITFVPFGYVYILIVLLGIATDSLSEFGSLSGVGILLLLIHLYYVPSPIFIIIGFGCLFGVELLWSPKFRI